MTEKRAARKALFERLRPAEDRDYSTGMETGGEWRGKDSSERGRDKPLPGGPKFRVMQMDRGIPPEDRE